MKPADVVVIDDSTLVIKLCTALFSHLKDLNLAETFTDPNAGLRYLETRRPKCVILDMEMPRMNGIDVLEKIIRDYPVPVVIFSSHTQKGSELSLKALEIGAVGVVAKSAKSISAKDQMWDALVKEVRSAVQVNVHAILLAQARRATLTHASTNTRAVQLKPRPSNPLKIEPESAANKRKKRVLLIGASTGGTQALEYLLSRLSLNSVPILVVQHMPPNFTGAFARRLNGVSALDVLETLDGTPLEAGKVYIAPGGKHLEVIQNGLRIITRVAAGPPVSNHTPSVDVLFKSAAKVFAGASVGVLLTGMGRDGGAGMKVLKDAGAHTIAQDKSTSVVFGMPGTAIELGGVTEVVALDQIAEKIEQCFYRQH